MLSAQFIRENADRVRHDIAARNTSAPMDRILELDDSRRSLLGVVEALRAERNAASKEIGKTKDAAEREQKNRRVARRWGPHQRARAGASCRR